MKNNKKRNRTISSYLADPNTNSRISQLSILKGYINNVKKINRNPSFLFYWGASNKQELDRFDYDSLLMLFGLIKTIERKYSTQIDLTVIFTDTHAYLNGYKEVNYMEYFNNVRNSLNSFNYKHILMSEIINPYLKNKGYSNTKRFIDNLIQKVSDIDADQFASNGIFKSFVSSAIKHSKRINSEHKLSQGFYSIEAAKLYLFINDIERKIITEKYKNYFFITYVSVEEQELTAPELPTIQIYSYRRGNRGRPWFTFNNQNNNM